MKKRPSKLSDWVSKCGYSLSLTSTQTFFLGRHFCPSYKTHNLTHTFTNAHTLRHSHLLTNPLSHHSHMYTLITHTHTFTQIYKCTHSQTLSSTHEPSLPTLTHVHTYYKHKHKFGRTYSRKNSPRKRQLFFT